MPEVGTFGLRASSLHGPAPAAAATRSWRGESEPAGVPGRSTKPRRPVGSFSVVSFMLAVMRVVGAWQYGTSSEGLSGPESVWPTRQFSSATL